MDELEKKIPVLCLGPKGSGKTTLLKKLQNAEGIDNTYSPVPTIGTNIYDIYYINKHGKKLVMSIREVGGEMAPLWHNYLDGVEKVIYVVDTSNLCQISAAAVLLYTLLAEPRLKNAKVYTVLVVDGRDKSTGSLGRKSKAVHQRDIDRGGIRYVDFKFILVLSKMDAAYRQMRNEALLMLQYARLSTELPSAPTLLEASPLTGEGIDQLKAALCDTIVVKPF